DAAPGDLVVAGSPPALDADSHGVVASLTPATAPPTAGQGTSARYTVHLVNTGSADDMFSLAATGLPAGITAAFAQNSVEVPPGASNSRDVTLVLTSAAGTAPADYPFTVSATSKFASATASGTLTVVSAGVQVALTPASGSPGGTFQLTVTNTGST